MPMTLSHFVRYLELNDDFHLELRRLSKSAMLLRTLDVVLALPFASPGALVFGAAEAAAANRMSHIALEHHHSIIEAIARREGTRAESLAREHARIARNNLERALADRDLFRHVPGASLIELAAGGDVRSEDALGPASGTSGARHLGFQDVAQRLVGIVLRDRRRVEDHRGPGGG